MEIGVGEIPSTAPGKKATRRSSTDLRKENVGLGALLLRLIWAGVNWVVPGSADVPETEKNFEFNSVNGKDTTARESGWRTCERKGFRVVKDTGCFAPHRQYCEKGKGASEKGYQLAFFALCGFVHKQHAKGEAMIDPATGKDLSWQLSHLCHCRWCCRIDHIVIEQGWRNKMRNFCLGPVRKFRLPGGRVIDSCGCSLQFHVMGQSALAGSPCVAAYAVSPDAAPSDLDVCQTFGQVKHVLSETNFPLKLQFVTYAKRETISEIRTLEKGDVTAKKKAKDLVATLSPPSKKLMKHGGGIAFGVEGNFDPAKTVVLIPDSDEDVEEPPSKKTKS